MKKNNPMEGEQKGSKELEDAILIATALETDGGKLIVKQLEKILSDYVLAPEYLLKDVQCVAPCVEMPSGLYKKEVDQALVASLYGARESLTSLKNWFDTCQRVVKKAADAKTA